MKELLQQHYKNGDTITITYNNRCLTGKITDVNSHEIIVEKSTGRFFIPISKITKVISND